MASALAGMPSADGGKVAVEPFPPCGAACGTVRIGGNELGAAVDSLTAAAERLEGRLAIETFTSILRGKPAMPVYGTK